MFQNDGHSTRITILTRVLGVVDNVGPSHHASPLFQGTCSDTVPEYVYHELVVTLTATANSRQLAYQLSGNGHRYRLIKTSASRSTVKPLAHSGK